MEVLSSDSDKELPSDYEEESGPAGAAETSVYTGSSHYPCCGSLGSAHSSLSAPNFSHSMCYASFYPPPSAMSSSDASGYEVEVR